MNSHRRFHHLHRLNRLALLASLGITAATAQTTPTSPASVAPTTPAAAAPTAPITPTKSKTAAPASFQDALTKGKLSINARLRYEHVEQDPLEDADALTLRLRLGYTTALYKGFQASVEGEHVAPIVNDYYDGTGTNGSNYATVADPEVTHLNQAWLAYTYDKTKGTIGRQKLILDNARFIGDVGWRQNDQTFDALVLQDKSFEKTTLTYAYLDRVNRVFDDSGTQPDYESNSHILNASYAGFPIGTLTAYAYLLEFDTDRASAKTAVRNNSNATYGLSFKGAQPLSKTYSVSYRLEYATQSDYGDSALNYDANYYVAELGLVSKPFTVTAGYEVLGSDNGLASFRTPLATLHAFNGWADVFLVTPPAGLTDTFFTISAPLPGRVNLLTAYHIFGTEDGASQLGQEWDVISIYKFNPRLSFTAKYAKFWSDQTGFADRSKVWLQADFAY